MLVLNIDSDCYFEILIWNIFNFIPILFQFHFYRKSFILKEVQWFWLMEVLCALMSSIK